MAQPIEWRGLDSAAQQTVLDEHREMEDRLWSLDTKSGEYRSLLEEIRAFEDAHDIPYYYRESY